MEKDKLQLEEEKLLKDRFEQRLICNKCKTTKKKIDKLYVFQIDWETYIMCPKCGTSALIHSG